MQHYDGDVRDLCLDFTVTEESLGKRHVIELKPGGKDACVTNENKLQYVHAMADYKLNRQVFLCILLLCWNLFPCISLMQAVIADTPLFKCILSRVDRYNIPFVVEVI